MRQIIAVMFAATVAFGSQGCCSCGAKPGFAIQYGWPSTVSQQTILGPQTTTFAGQGLASGPVAGAVGVFSAEATPLALRTVERAPCLSADRNPLERAPMPRRDLAPAGDCQTLQDVCDKIDRGFSSLASALDRSTRAMSQKPMPKPEQE